MASAEGNRLLPSGRASMVLLCLGILFQLVVAVFFYLNLYPDVQRLMPDDVFYYLKIARNIVQGHGSVFSPGEPTNGYHPLWMGLLVIVQFIFQPGRELLILLVLIISVVINGFTALLLRRLLFRLGFSGNQQTAGMVLYLFLPWLVLLNLSGLETPLFFTCLVFFFMMVQRVLASEKGRTGEYALLGVAAGLLFLSRTDSVFFIITGAAFILRRKRTLRALGGLMAAAAATAVMTLPWLIWCWTRFGSPVQSSGMALSYFRWHTMHPVGTPEFWVLNGGRLFHKLAVIFMSPFVYRAGSFENIIPLWCDAVMFAAVAAIVVYMVRKRDRMILPPYIWLPSVLLLVFYTFVRVASAVWHMSVFPFLLLLILVNVLGRVRWNPVKVTAALTAALLVNLYTLGNGFYHPQQAVDMMGSAISTGAGSSDPLVIGATDAGYLGYFISDMHTVVNLDGVVNQRAFVHIRAGTLDEYLEEIAPDILRISPEMLEFCTRNSTGRM